MSKANTTVEKRARLKRKIRSKVSGTSECPRLSVYRSNSHMYAQLIDDTTSTTLASASDMSAKKGAKLVRAEDVGKAIAEAALAKGKSVVVFDRNGFRYAGRVRAMADSARKHGLKF